MRGAGGCAPSDAILTSTPPSLPFPPSPTLTATQGFFRLAPGESAEVGKTPERTYYVYAHELGDPECTLGCWSGKVEYELQGELWPFMEKTMKGAKPGDTVNHKFSC